MLAKTRFFETSPPAVAVAALVAVLVAAPAALGAPAELDPNSATPDPSPVAGGSAMSAPATDAGEDPVLSPLNIPDVPPAKPATSPEASIDQAPSLGPQGQTAPVMGGQTAGQTQASGAAKGKYSRPLLFAPEDNGIEFTSPQIRWNLVKGQKINLGGLIFGSSSIRLTIDQIDREAVSRRYRTGRLSKFVTNVSFQWPSIMARTGRMTAELENGTAIWSADIDEEKRADWVSALKADSDKLFKAHYRNTWGLIDIDPKAAFLKSETRFRFCLAQTVTESERIRICSSLHVTSRSGDTIKIEPINENRTPNVYIGKDAFGTRATVNFPESRKIDLRVLFANGSSVALTSRPIQVKFLDVVLDSAGENLILTGKGLKPLGKVKELHAPPNHFWSATGLGADTVWQMSIRRNIPTLRVLGAWNVPFTYLIRYDALPAERDRVFINTRTGSGTYVNGARIRVLSPQGAKLSTKETSLQQLPNAKNEFRWNFLAKDKGKNNKARITIEGSGDDKQDWVAHYQLYRGYPYEVSGRLTGIVSADMETVLIGEIAAGAWFERLFGMDSYYLSERRWGMNIRYFRALQAFAFSSGSTALSEFSVANLDLRYNLIPGIWNRDELFGLIASVEFAEIGGLKANLGGVGAYWARTMPRVFDDIVNILPFFRYPKYVDMEFIYYPLAASAGVEPGASYNLNFHGKVFWTPRVYGEAGFGIKQFDYISRSAESEVSVSTAYGTIGLGMIF